MMVRPNKRTSIDDYINNQPKEAQILLKDLQSAIKNAVPKATESFNYGVPAFTLVEGGNMKDQIMIAGFKNHVGFYPHSTTIDHFAKELSGFKKGKGSVQFPFDKPISKPLIIKMVKYCLKLIKNY